MARKATYHVDMKDTTPQDLGPGLVLSFQRSVKDSTKLRAVIKQDGKVVITSEVMGEDQAFHARISAISNLRNRNYNLSHGLRPDATEEEQKEALLDMARKMGML